MSTPRTDAKAYLLLPNAAPRFVVNAEDARELEAEIAVYRDTLKLAAFRFRTMGSDTAASDIESVLKSTEAT